MKKLSLWLVIIALSISIIAAFSLNGCKKEAVPVEEVKEEAPEVEEEEEALPITGEEALLNEMKSILKELGTSESDVEKIIDVNEANMALNGYYNEMGIHAYSYALLKHFEKVTKPIWVDKDIEEFFEEQGFREMLMHFGGENQILGELYGGFKWEPGMGEEFVGEISDLPYKDLFTDYIPLPEGPILDPNKTYRIGFTNLGLAHPWLLANAENALWEASRHSNIEFELMDGEFDDSKMNQHIDTWVAKEFDGIMIWPAKEEPLAAAVQRAADAGIPSVDMDRKVNNSYIYHIVPNTPENGLQNGLYVIWKTLAGGGNIALSRKPLGATTDAGRTGFFIQVLGSFTGYNIVASYHTDSNAVKSYEAIKDALQANKDLDIVFTTGDEEGKGAVQAIIEADRMDTGKYGKILVVFSDDSREVLKMVEEGSVDQNSPSTPLTGAIGLRLLINQIGVKEGIIPEDEALPQYIILPNVPMVTKEKEIIFGIETQIPEEWVYGYGPVVE